MVLTYPGLKVLVRRRVARGHTVLTVIGAVLTAAACAVAFIEPVALLQLFHQPRAGNSLEHSSRSSHRLRKSREGRRGSACVAHIISSHAANSASEDWPTPVLTAPLQRLEFKEKEIIGAGYDLIDVRLLTASKEPIIASFMLDSGLSTNLVTDTLMTLLELPGTTQSLDSSSLGGAVQSGKLTELAGLEILGDAVSNETHYTGVWEGGSWRARCSLNWDALVAEASSNGGKVSNAEVEYTVLPTEKMTEDQIEKLVGMKGTETVEGTLSPEGFVGQGVSVWPKGFLAITDSYEFRKDGDELIEVVSGTRMRREPAYSSIRLPGPVSAVCVPFVQEELAAKQKVAIGGMLGQLPFHRLLSLEIDPVARRLAAYRAEDAERVAAATGLVRLPGEDLSSGLVGIRITHSPLLSSGGGQDPLNQKSVPALVDTGSSYSILNWAAAELLLGLQKDDNIVKDAPLIRGMGVGGGMVDFALLTISIGLITDQTDPSTSVISPQPVRVAIGDASLFDDIVGLEESGSWFGLGPKKQKPAALVGQDLLSQQRYLLASAEPAMYISPQPPPWQGKLTYVGPGDCLDSLGQRLRGLQKLATTPDEAALTCLEMPAGTCKGVAVTPLTERRFQGLCYIFVDSEEAGASLEDLGWRRYAAPRGQDLAAVGAEVAKSDGSDGAECYALQPTLR